MTPISAVALPKFLIIFKIGSVCFTVNPLNVETPATFKLSNSVCPSTSKSTKSPLPTNVVAVITPATLTSFANNVLPVTVVIPPNRELPRTSNNLSGCVEPIPTR